MTRAALPFENQAMSGVLCLRENPEGRRTLVSLHVNEKQRETQSTRDNEEGKRVGSQARIVAESAPLSSDIFAEL